MSDTKYTPPTHTTPHSVHHSEMECQMSDIFDHHKDRHLIHVLDMFADCYVIAYKSKTKTKTNMLQCKLRLLALVELRFKTRNLFNSHRNYSRSRIANA